MSSRIQPCHAPAQQFDRQCILFEIAPVDLRDLQCAARRGLERPRKIDHPFIVEIQSRHRVTRSRALRLLFQRNCPSPVVELDHPIAIGIVHLVGKHARAGLQRGCVAQLR